MQPKTSPARFLLFLSILIITTAKLFAVQSVSLTWSANTEATLSGYRLYVGTASRAYSSFTTVTAPATSGTVQNLAEGQRYYFAVTAYNSSGLESSYSSEISYLVPLSSPNLAPTLNPLANMTLNEDAPSQTVALSGISSGSSTELQPLTVTVTSSAPALISPTISYTSPNSTGTLSFTPAVNAYGTAVISVTVSDAQTSNSTVSRSFTVTVNPVNDPPTLNPIANVVLLQNSSAISIALTGISSGAANEVQGLTVSATSSNPALLANPSIHYASPGTTAGLTLAPLANAWGDAIVTVTVSDGQSANNPITRSFRVTVNNPPTLNTIADQTIPSDGSTRTVSLAGITSGAANEAQSLQVTAVSSVPGLVTPVVTYTSPASTGTLSLKAAPGSAGTAQVTVTVSDGQNGNNLASRSFLVTVTSGNRAPTLDAIPNITIVQNSVTTVALTGITSGATNELQTLTVTALSSNQGVVVSPAVHYASPSTTAALSIAAAPNAWGTVVIAVTVNDGAATNSTVTRTFAVTVNNPPTLAAISNLSLPPSAPRQTVLLQGISSGAPNESQVLSVSTSSSNPALIPTPTVSYSTPNSTGTLSFTPVANVSGSAIITVTVLDGQFSNNSVSRSFQVSVAAPALSVASFSEPTAFSENPPVVSDFVVAAKDARTLAFAFQSDSVCDATVDYGLTAQLGTSVSATSGTNHLALIEDLQPGTTYYVRARVRGLNQQTAATDVGTVSTATISTVSWPVTSGSLVFPMRVEEDPSMSADAYMHTASANNGSARFELTVPEGLSYRLWCRARIPAEGGSFAIDLDGATRAECTLTGLTGDGSEPWQWLQPQTSGQAVAFLLPAGAHTLTIFGRDVVTLFDQFALSNDPQWKPNP